MVLNTVKCFTETGFVNMVAKENYIANISAFEYVFTGKINNCHG